MDLKREILSWILYIGFVILATWLILHFVGQRTVVDGRSMNDTLQDGDNLIVEKLSYRFGDPQRFDIIVFQPYEDSSELYIKRIIGLPGETVRIDEDGSIYIDGELLEEDYGRETIENPGRASEEITLGEDEYFVLGDNRNNSTDSRTERVGNVSLDSIVGKAWLRIWPLSSFGFLTHQ
ncbi:MAG: signal peptidase I [Lachnospiraceae bacterium]|nr:signal peptidase I [Lachnospiraceae bacterium]